MKKKDLKILCVNLIKKSKLNHRKSVALFYPTSSNMSCYNKINFSCECDIIDQAGWIHTCDCRRGLCYRFQTVFPRPVRSTSVESHRTSLLYKVTYIFCWINSSSSQKKTFKNWQSDNYFPCSLLLEHQNTSHYNVSVSSCRPLPLKINIMLALQ